jgi:hypothetical protein
VRTAIDPANRVWSGTCYADDLTQRASEQGVAQFWASPGTEMNGQVMIYDMPDGKYALWANPTG